MNMVQCAKIGEDIFCCFLGGQRVHVEVVDGEITSVMTCSDGESHMPRRSDQPECITALLRLSEAAQREVRVALIERFKFVVE